MRKKKSDIKFNEGEILTFQQVFDNEIEPLTQEEYNKRKEASEKSHNKFLNEEEWRKFIIWKTIKTEQIAVKIEDDKYEIKEINYYSNQIKDLVQCQSNLDALFKYHPILNKFMFDEFSKDKLYDNKIYDEDVTPSIIFNFFRREFNGWCPRPDIKETITETLDNNRCNIVTDYFDSLVWDGVERLETFMIDYYNADDTPLNRVYFKRWMIALTKRVYEPGAKFDNMLVLEGDQGKKKSSFGEWLGTIMGKIYYNHLPADLKDIKQLVYATKNAFIVMNDDFDDICDKGNIGTIKEFITKRNDHADLKYQHAKDYPRHYVLLATTNSKTFLSDDKTFDERRFWIIHVNPENTEFNLSEELKEQLYAEAVYIYKTDNNIKLWIYEPELIQAEKELQKNYKKAADDPMIESVLKIFERKYPIENGIFKNEDEFIKLVNQETEPYDTDYEFFGDSQTDNTLSSIKLIPAAWIIKYLQNYSIRSIDRIIQILHTQGYKVEKKQRYHIYDKQLTVIKINN